MMRSPPKIIYLRENFLIERPLLRALQPHPNGPPILLIDELDRADEAFEAYLAGILVRLADYHSGAWRNRRRQSRR